MMRSELRSGVPTNDAIPLVAALAAQEHGDARKAIDILRHGGRIAKRADATEVTERHIREAKEKTEADRFAELVGGAPAQAKVIMYALTELTRRHDRGEFTSKRIHSAYREVADEIGMDALSERRTREILKEQDFLNVIDSTKESRGRGQGGRRNTGCWRTQRSC